MMDPAELVVMGASVIDLIGYTSRFPKPGETVTGDNFAKGFGGKSANMCIVASRLGVSTAMLGKIGDDDFGKEYLENYKAAGVNIDHLAIMKGEQTSVALISVTNDGQNSIIYVPGAANYLDKNDIQAAESMIQNAKLFCVTNECQSETLLAAVQTCKKHQVPVLLNAAPVVSSDRKEAYSYADILCLNETEAEAETGIHVENIEDAKLALQKLLQLKCGKTVIITLGAKGALFASLKDPSPTYVIAQKVKPIDTTGAGDAFVGALAYYLVKHPDLSLMEKVKRSCEIATFSVLKAGTQSSFPWRKELPQELFL